MQHIEPINFEPAKPPAIKPKRRLSLVKIIVILFLLLFSIIAWFILGAKSIRIDVVPSHADVGIKTPFKLALADRILLRKGKYGITIQAEGYYSIDGTLELKSAQNQEFDYTLKPLPGQLEIDVNGIEGASITLNGEKKGIAPTTLKDIDAGKYELNIEAERYFPYKQTITIEGRGITQTLAPELKPAWADIEFASSPTESEIIIGEAVIGQTPYKVELLEGKYEVAIRKAGFKPWQKTINVTAGETMAFNDISLLSADARLILSSQPVGASVTVNGSYRGLTPLELALAPDKQNAIHLRKQGYKTKTSSINIQSGETKRLNLAMSPELVTVTFNIQPADADVFVNGKLAQLSDKTLALPTTKQSIEIRKKGYVDYQTSLTPHAGTAQQVKAVLKTLEQKKLENIKPIITTHAGQKLKLFYPYGFTMGASRREPGRRANEAIQEVTLERAFYLGLNEVTNEQFSLYKKGHNAGLIQGHTLNKPTQPVVNISWEESALYCNWLSEKESLKPFYLSAEGRITGTSPSANGYRLPTEAEWAWAARTISKNELLKHPWGDGLPPKKNSGNYADSSAANFLGKIINDYTDGYATTAPVGSFPANHKGLFDIGGNVAEWVHDYYSARSGNNTADVDPLGPDKGEFHVVRGASWAHGTITELRLSFRDYTDKARDDIGFRIARYLE